MKQMAGKDTQANIIVKISGIAVWTARTYKGRCINLITNHILLEPDFGDIGIIILHSYHHVPSK